MEGAAYEGFFFHLVNHMYWFTMKPSHFYATSSAGKVTIASFIDRQNQQVADHKFMMIFHSGSLYPHFWWVGSESFWFGLWWDVCCTFSQTCPSWTSLPLRPWGNESCQSAETGFFFFFLRFWLYGRKNKLKSCHLFCHCMVLSLQLGEVQWRIDAWLHLSRFLFFHLFTESADFSLKLSIS